MKRVYAAHDPLLIGYLRSLVEGRGIPCTVRNELLIGGAGELPPTDCWPEIWVLDDDDAATARSLIEFALATSRTGGEAWRCPRCGEQSEPHFAACWNCGGTRPHTGD